MSHVNFRISLLRAANPSLFPGVPSFKSWCKRYAVLIRSGVVCCLPPT